MKRKVTGVVIALTMCLNAMPTTVMAENESPQGGDIKTVSESGGQSEEIVADETTPTKEVDNSKGEKGETKAEKGKQKEKEPTEEENKAEEKKDESKDSKAPSAEENKQQEEETKAEKGEQEEKEPTEEENKAEEKKDESKDSKAPSAEENKQQEEETKAEKTTNEVKQPAAETQATPLTVQEGIAVQAELDESNAAAKVETKDGTTTYYSNIEGAFASTLSGGSVVTALKSDTTHKEINFNTPGEGVTFDLNGYNLSGIKGTIQSGAILKVVNDKNRDPHANTGLIYVNSGGTLIFSPKASFTFMQLYNNGGNITLSGGCFYICKGSQNKPIAEYLKEGYAYKTKGALMEYAEARKTTTYSSGDLYAVECNHSDTVRDNDTGRYYCKYCNMKIPFTMTQEPNQDQLNSIVYHGDNNGAMIPFVFSRHDSIESNVKVRYSIDKGTEIEKTLSNNTLNLIDELNQFPAGTHTLTLSAEYGGYTMPSRTYTFTVLQSGSEINVTNYTESAKYSDTGFISIYGKVTPTGTAVSTNTNSISTYSNDSTLGSVEIYCDNKKVGTGTLNKETNYVSFTAFVMLSNIGAGKKTLTIKYIGNGSMADAETSIDVTVEKLTPTISWDGYPDGKSYTGSAIADPQPSDITVGNGGSFEDIITFDWYKANKNGDNYTKVGEKLSSNPVNAGDYIVEAVFKETDKTNAVTISKGITINKKDYETNNNEPIIESFDVYVTSFEQTYKVDLKNVLEKNNISGITENDVFTTNTVVKLEGQPKSAAIVAGENKLEIVMNRLSTESQKNVGTVEICFSSTNYNSIKMEFVLNSVNKPERNLSVTMDNWTYGDKTAKDPVYNLPEENPKLKTVSYAKKNGTVLNAVPTPTDAGEYKVTVKAEYDDYVYTGSADFTIIPKDISNDNVNVKVTLDHNTFEYDGTQKRVNVVSVVVDREPLELGKDYGISSISGADAGTYVIKITGNGYNPFTKKYVGNYVGEYTVNWTITPKPVTPSVEVTGTYTYTGSEIKPTIVVKDGETVIPESEYEVSCKNNINAGTGRIIITDKDGGNYIVNGEKEFTIEKAEVTIKALDKDRRRGRGMLDIPATLTEGEDYTVTGLKGDDKLGGTISISFAETEDSSKYDINITADGINENYTPVYEKGTLNIYKNGTDESDPSYTGGSSSGGGSSSSSKNDVTVDKKTENGKITIDKDSASKGSTVTITVTPDEGYEVDEIKVTDESGNEIKVTDKGNGKYTFTMPATDADIKADFKAISDEEEKTVITMQIGNTDVSVNEKTITNDVAPVIRNDRTLVPIRVVTETLGGKVDWNNATKEVTLNIDGKEIKMTIGVILEKYGVAPMIINDRTYVPIRFVAEELGAEVQWNEETKTVTIIKQ